MFQIKRNLRPSVCASSLAERDYRETYEIRGVQTDCNKHYTSFDFDVYSVRKISLLVWRSCYS